MAMPPVSAPPAFVYHVEEKDSELFRSLLYSVNRQRADEIFRLHIYVPIIHKKEDLQGLGGLQALWLNHLYNNPDVYYGADEGDTPKDPNMVKVCREAMLKAHEETLRRFEHISGPLNPHL